MSTLSTHTAHTCLTQLSAIFGSKGNVRQIQGSNIYAHCASDREIRGEQRVGERERESETEQTFSFAAGAHEKCRAYIKKGATGTANLAGRKKEPFNTRCDKSQTINAHIKDKSPLGNNEFEML